VVEVDPGQVRPPRRHRLALEQPQALEAKVEHPLGLVLLGRDVADHVLVQAPARAGTGRVEVGPAVLVIAQNGELLGRGGARLLLGHPCPLSDRGFTETRPGMWVVQPPSPLAIVASRCTCVPTSREITWVSASHSCGNSAATWATGQWCWHSWPPDAIVEADAA